MLYWLETLMLAPKQMLANWFRHHEVHYRNPGASIRFPCFLYYDDINAIQIGQLVSIGSFSEIVVSANSQDSKIAGKLVISGHTVIGSHANIRAAGGKIYIEKNCLIAQQVSLIASAHKIVKNELYRYAPWDEIKTGIHIEENVWIGASVTILPGCTIGQNSIIGAGSVVTKSIPANQVWAGVPAKKIRSLVTSHQPSGCSDPL
jgi:acetyltransferase-like isoleucine patch superfamily enzyme